MDRPRKGRATGTPSPLNAPPLHAALCLLLGVVVIVALHACGVPVAP